MNAVNEGPAGIAAEITIRIDRLVVETEEPVDAFAFQTELAAAVRLVVAERGVPDCWSRGVRRQDILIEGFAWDGQGAEPGLARALAARIYEGVLP